jgi:phage terminase large subunit-like protein
MLITEIQHAGVDPDLMCHVPMGHGSMAAPSLHFEGLVYGGKYDHGGDPVLSWHARNAVCRYDENLNIMPAKKKSGERIDGIIAAIVGLAAWMGQEEPAPMPMVIGL